MRNFILSSNFKNSVKASFLSLVILIASLSFGCCFNASAMNDDFPFWKTNSPSKEQVDTYEMNCHQPLCDCPSTNIYEDEFPAFGVNSPEMNIFDLYCSQNISLDEATANFKELYDNDSPEFEARCKDILFENGVNRVKREFNLETKLGTHGKRDFPPGTTKEKEINQNFLNELSKGINTDSVNNAETKKYPDLWQVEEKLGQDFNRSEYFRAQLMGEEYPFPLWTSSSSDDFCYETGNNNNDSNDSNNSPMPNDKTFYKDFKTVYHSSLYGIDDNTAAENASKEQFPDPNDQDYQIKYKDILISCVDKAREKKYAQKASTLEAFEEKVCKDYYNYK